MNAIEFNQLLIDLDACADARAWAKGKDLKTVWNTCDRGDWLLWLCGKMAGKKGWPTQKQVVLAACDCAETALKYVPEGYNRPKNAIRTARVWARGRATLAQVRDARHAATAYAAEAAARAAADAARAAADAADAADADAAEAAAYAAEAAAEAAAYAAEAAAYAAYAAKAAADAAYAAAYAAEAAAYAAYAAAYAAYAAAYADARTSAETSKELAEIVRSRLSPKAVR